MAGFLSKLQFPAQKPFPTPSASKNYREHDIHDPRIIYQVQPRARRISIKMDAARREMVVNAPTLRQIPAAKRFAKEKADWIAVHLEALPAPQPFISGGKILFRGEMTNLVNPGGRARPKYIARSETHDGQTAIPGQLIIPAPDGALEGRAKRFLIRQAREALELCTAHHAAQLGQIVTKITVRDTKSRWGSCAADGHISYSWRLICAPPFVLDYVCAQEVSHIIEANHSRAFWDVVDGLVDTVKPAKRWLRDNGAYLHAVGAIH